MRRYALCPESCIVVIGLRESCSRRYHRFQNNFGPPGVIRWTLSIIGAEEGDHYVLEVHTLGDGSWLDAGKPRLRMEGAEWEHKEYDSRGVPFFLAAVFIVALGTTILGRSLATQKHYGKTQWALLGEMAPQPAGARHDPGLGSPTPGKAPATPKIRYLPPAAWLGIVLVVLGVTAYRSIQHWMVTRIFVPVNMPISLAPGNIKTGPFHVNVRDMYTPWIHLDGGLWGYPPANCDFYTGPYTEWVLRRDGGVVKEWQERSLFDAMLRGIDIEKGTYDLSVNVLADASCLNGLHPTLRLEADESPYTFYISILLWASALFAAVGICLLILFGYSQFRERNARAVSFGISDSVGYHFNWANKFRVKQIFTGLPPFIVVSGSIGLILGFIYFLFLLPATPRGLKVHLLAPKGSAPNVEPALPPVVVELEDGGLGTKPDLYLNGGPVLVGTLDVELKKQLRLRPDWIVYVRADPNVNYGDVVQVIDIVRGMGLEVVLLSRDTHEHRAERGAPRFPHTHQNRSETPR
jgi:biopolymer transport protein TolR